MGNKVRTLYMYNSTHTVDREIFVCKMFALNNFRRCLTRAIDIALRVKFRHDG